MNGTQKRSALALPRLLVLHLNQGRLRPAPPTATPTASRQHPSGSPRNLGLRRHPRPARLRPGPLRFRPSADGAVLGTNGPVMPGDGGRRGPGEVALRPVAPAPRGRRQAEARGLAAPWVPIDEIRVIVNGRQVKKLDGAALSGRRIPSAPRAAPLRGSCPRGAPAGRRRRLAGDRRRRAAPRRRSRRWAEDRSVSAGEPDGIPDHDGQQRRRPGRRRGRGPRGAASGPQNPAPPPEADPRYHFAKVVPGGTPWPHQPLRLDRDGDGRFRPVRMPAGQGR